MMTTAVIIDIPFVFTSTDFQSECTKDYYTVALIIIVLGLGYKCIPTGESNNKKFWWYNFTVSRAAQGHPAHNI